MRQTNFCSKELRHHGDPDGHHKKYVGNANRKIIWQLKQKLNVKIKSIWVILEPCI